MGFSHVFPSTNANDILYGVQVQEVKLIGFIFLMSKLCGFPFLFVITFG